MKDTNLDEYVKAGLHGRKELKVEERQKYLGQFRERVLKIMNEDEIRDIRYMDAMIKNMEDPRARKLLIRGDVTMEDGAVLIQKAEEKNIDFTFIDEQMVKGSIAVVLACDHATNEENIHLGISDLPKDFYIHKGKRICKECYEYINRNYNNEIAHFKKMGIIDYLTGMKCPIESQHN